jgi:hypothetical protein
MGGRQRTSDSDRESSAREQPAAARAIIIADIYAEEWLLEIEAIAVDR